MLKPLLIVFCLQEVLSASPLRIVGSSTVFPFAATVAEHFHYKTNEPTPLIESTGTGAGIKLFCGAEGPPDGVIASRPFTKTEKQLCLDHNVTFEEFVIGKDGLVVIQNKGDNFFSLTLKDLTEALDEKIPKGEICIKNPHKTWKDVQPIFPNYPIRVLGPAPTSGTYDVLMEKTRGICGPYLRTDGGYIEAPTNENLIIQKVLNSPQTLGIVTFSFFERNRERLNSLMINGILPTLKSIQDGTYSFSRPLYFYIKTNNLLKNPSRVSYALEFTSETAIGAAGYLNKKGLVPLAPEEQKAMHKRAEQLGVR